MDSVFRQLKAEERDLLEKLLEPEFEGRDELRSQLIGVVARELHEDGTLSLRCSSGSPAPGKHRLVAEGVCKDVDGMNIEVLLHVDKIGFMHMLEILKYGISPIIHAPTARDLVVLGKNSGRR